MCLNTFSECAKYAHKDITCYKVVKQLGEKINGKPVYESPVYVHHYILGEEYTEENFSEWSEKSSYIGITSRVEKGFHTYTNFEAIQERFDAGTYNLRTHVVLKCIIPRDSPYFESFDSNQYCSQRIKSVAEMRYISPGVWKERKWSRQLGMKE